MRLGNKIYSRLVDRAKSLTPGRLLARINGITVIANSIPKGGTHVLTRCLSLFPCLSYSYIHYTKGVPDVKVIERLIRKTGKGRFFAAHLWWDKDCADALKKADVKSIVMIRDPRDIIISGVFYILKRDDHHLHDFFKKLSSLDEQIRFYIKGVDSSHSKIGIPLHNIRKSMDNYLAWENESFNILIKFEDLIGPHGGGDFNRQLAQVSKINHHLNFKLPESSLVKIAQNTFFSKSVTFRKGTTGEWRNYLTKEHKKLFKDVSSDLLISLGYEANNDW